jgi:aerotaxis receptor
MPRAVFQLLWSYLDQGKPFAGFVKNMAADGCYYWVMALVVPIDGGYLSVRLKPSSAFFPVVRDLYTELLTIERAAGDGGGAWRAGMAAATARLVEAIGSLGFASYDEFMRIALAAELSGHRDAQRAFAASGHEPEAVTADLAPTLASCGAVEHGLDDLFSRVDGLLATIKQLGTAATYVLGLAGDIHLISLNALVGSCRLERGGEGLSVVTEDLARLSQECTDNVNAMAVQLRELSASLGETAFSVTAAKLQIEMTSCFIRELSHERLASRRHADARLRGDLRTLTGRSRRAPRTSSRRCRGAAPIPRSSACSTTSRPTCAGCRACTSSAPSRPWASPRPACSASCSTASSASFSARPGNWNNWRRAWRRCASTCRCSSARRSMPGAPPNRSAPWPSGPPEPVAVRRTLHHHNPSRGGYAARRF